MATPLVQIISISKQVEGYFVAEVGSAVTFTNQCTPPASCPCWSPIPAPYFDVLCHHTRMPRRPDLCTTPLTSLLSDYRHYSECTHRSVIPHSIQTADPQNGVDQCPQGSSRIRAFCCALDARPPLEHTNDCAFRVWNANLHHIAPDADTQASGVCVCAIPLVRASNAEGNLKLRVKERTRSEHTLTNSADPKLFRGQM